MVQHMPHHMGGPEFDPQSRKNPARKQKYILQRLPFSHLSQHLLYKLVLSEIGKRVSMVAKNISRKELDAVFMADLVDFNYHVPGAASQTYLQKERAWV